MQFKLKNFDEVITVSRLANLHYFEFSRQFHGKLDNHPFRELVFTDNGSIDIHSDHYNGPLNKNQLIIHEAGENHFLTCRENEPPNVIVIGFECDCRDLDRFSSSPVTLSTSLTHMLTEVVKEGRTVFLPPYDIPYDDDMKKRTDYPFGADQMIRLRLELFLISLVRSWETSGSSSVDSELQESDHLREIRRYIDTNYCTNIRLDELCVLFHTNKTSLCSNFKTFYNTTVLDYIHQLRIRKAKIMLREGKENVTQIASVTGFNTVHYFSQMFKKYEHMTPTEYRRSIKAHFEEPDFL